MVHASQLSQRLCLRYNMHVPALLFSKCCCLCQTQDVSEMWKTNLRQDTTTLDSFKLKKEWLVGKNTQQYLCHCSPLTCHAEEPPLLALSGTLHQARFPSGQTEPKTGCFWPAAVMLWQDLATALPCLPSLVVHCITSECRRTSLLAVKFWFFPLELWIDSPKLSNMA